MGIRGDHATVLHNHAAILRFANLLGEAITAGPGESRTISSHDVIGPAAG